MTEKFEKSFTVVESSGNEKEFFRRKISQISGVPATKVKENELKDLNAIMLQEEIDDETGLKEYILLKKYLDVHLDLFHDPSEAKVRRVGENQHLLGIFIDGLLDNKPKRYSYGRHIPTYFKLLQDKKTGFQNNPQRSVLIGALSIDTAMAFTATTKHVLSGSETFVIDIQGEQTKSAHNFSIADGSRTAFPNASITTVQTNSLLHSLEHESSNTPRKSFYQETLRILQPGGALIMVEGNLSTPFNSRSPEYIKHELAKEIKEVGFVDVQVTQPVMFNKEIDAYNFLRSTGGSIAPEVIGLDMRSFAVSATKKN